MKTHILILCITASLACTHQARAHAFIDHADPKVGSQLHPSPPQVKIWFTQKLIIMFSNLQILDAAGKEVDKHDKKLDPADPTLLTVSIPALKPGKYKVVWRATSVDTHVTTGDFTFEVTP
ncbi:MAG: copper resistance protein CopC [Chthoniobacteraceae bacterium]